MSCKPVNRDNNQIDCTLCNNCTVIGHDKDYALAAFLEHVLEIHYGLKKVLEEKKYCPCCGKPE